VRNFLAKTSRRMRPLELGRPPVLLPQNVPRESVRLGVEGNSFAAPGCWSLTPCDQRRTIHRLREMPWSLGTRDRRLQRITDDGRESTNESGPPGDREERPRRRASTIDRAYQPPSMFRRRRDLFVKSSLGPGTHGPLGRDRLPHLGSIDEAFQDYEEGHPLNPNLLGHSGPGSIQLGWGTTKARWQTSGSDPPRAGNAHATAIGRVVGSMHDFEKHRRLSEPSASNPTSVDSVSAG